MKKRGRILLAAAALGTAVLVLAVFFMQPAQQLPVPALPQQGRDEKTEYSFSEDFLFPKVEECAVYTLEVGSPGELLRQVEATLKVADMGSLLYSENETGKYYLLKEQDLTVSVNDKNGFWAATKNDAAYEGLQGPVVPENLPSKEDAVKLARAYIEENGLFRGELGEPVVGYSSTGDAAAGNEQKMDVSVMFTPPIDGKAAYGLYRITLTFGENGVIRDVFKQASPAAQMGQTVKLKTREQVMEEILSHPETLSASAAESLKKGILTSCELAYYVDGETVQGKNYAYPVYVLTGEGESVGESAVKAQEKVSCSVLVDAVQR